MAELVLSLRNRELSRTPILHPKFTLGRDAGCDVVIDNAGVSRTHVVILWDDNVFRVRDMNSQNGITVNGRAVKEAVLGYGDVLGIGKFQAQLIESEHEITPEAGSYKQPAAPHNVIGTMQMDAHAAAAIRDKIAKKQGGGAVPAGQPAAGQALAARAPQQPAARPQPVSPARPQPAAIAHAQAVLSDPVPPPPAIAWKPIAIGAGVLLVVLGAAASLLF